MRTPIQIQAVAGVFYLNATAAGAFDTVVSQANLTIATAGHVDTESWSGYADVSYSVTESSLTGIGKQAKVVNVAPAAGGSDALWSLVYRGAGFVGAVTVAGPNASQTAVRELGQQAYEYAAKSLS